MRVIYDVYYRDYWHHKSDHIGSITDFWKEVSLDRGRELALRYFSSLVKDPSALFVLAEWEKRTKI